MTRLFWLNLPCVGVFADGCSYFTQLKELLCLCWREHTCLPEPFKRPICHQQPLEQVSFFFKTSLSSASSSHICIRPTTHLIFSSNNSSNRKRTLKFDVEAGLVSDSMVGNSLSLQNQNQNETDASNQNQNGSDASSSGGAPFKTEPQD